MNKIHVTMEVNTQYDPHQWRTVASSTTFLAGRAVISAAENALAQLKKLPLSSYNVPKKIWMSVAVEFI